MNKKFTKLMAALALLVFMTPSMAGWGQTRDNVTVTKTMNQVVSENDYTVSANSDVTCYTSIDLNNYINMSTSGEPNCGSFWGTTTYDWRLYQNKSGDVTITVTDGTLVSVKFTYNGNNGGTLKNGSTAVSSGTTVNASGTSITLTVGNTGNATNGQVRITAVEVVYSTGGSTTTPTTVTIDATGITNTDIYAGTAAGSLSATVTETESGNEVSGATVTWASSDPTVATIDQTGAVTLVAVGTTNITATYAGDQTYAGSVGTYQLTVVDNTPSTDTDVTFVAGTDTGDTSVTKDGITVSMSVMNRTDNYRCYANSNMTVTSAAGKTITKVVLTCVTGNGANNFGIPTGSPGSYSYSQNNLVGTWTGNTNEVKLHASSQVRMTQIVVTYETDNTPTITVTPDLVEVAYDGDGGTLDLTYENLPIEDMTDFYIQYYDAEGVETEMPDWIDDLLVAEQDPSIGEGYVVSYVVSGNDGSNARSAYFKVYALDEEAELVYSNLVTINQAGGVLYGYSNNGVIGNISLAGQGTTITLAEGTNLNGTFVFAGWTTDPNDVSELLTSYTFPNDDTPVTFYAVYTKATSGTRTAANYVKVTSTDDLEDGDYLIVYEEGAVAFDGSRDKTESPKLDDTNNTISVFDYLNDGVIASNETTDAAVFTIAAIDGGYSIQSASGYYIGQTSNTNGMAVSDETVFTNSISITVDHDATITSGGAYMRYNSASNQQRFRYYKSDTYTGQKAIQLYKKQGGSAPTPVVLPTYFTRVFLNENVTDDIEITGPSIIPSGSVLDMGEDYVLTNDLGVSRLIIEDGGQLYSVLGVDATAQKNITGRENGGGWNFITSPIFAVEMDPATAGMTTGNYDLYRFNPSVEPAANGNTYEWENYKSHGSDFTVEGGHGYLYANLNDVVLQFSGVVNNDETVVSYEYNEESDSEWKEWHLVGNPYMYEAYAARSYYVISNGQIVSSENTVPVAPCEGIMIEGTDGSVEFTKDASDATDGGNLQMTVAQQVVTRDGVSTGSTTIDNAIVSFNEGSRLGKFYFGENDANIYIPQNGKEYAIVSAEAQGEMPVNFRAAKNGTYTLTINPEGVEMNYLHLIDNMTSANIDLLQTPSYTFNASMNDYESRFKLVFAAGSSTGSEASETFAFFTNGELIVSNEGEATLQVVDMTGRILSSQSLNGNGSVKVNAPVGVYVLRLINGNEVKTQKIVVR